MSDEDEPPRSDEDELPKEIKYTAEFEQLLKENGDHAQVYSILHQMSYIKYKNKYDYCNIPLIIITAIIGFITGISIGYDHINVILGSASVFVSIMKSVVSYLKLSERSENHRICSLQFGQISNEIKIELSLRRQQRQPAKIMLDIIKVKFKNLLEVAQLLDRDIIAKFKDKYMQEHDETSKDVSFPPVFSEIPGIKILGSTNDAEHSAQLTKNLHKYIEDRKYERQQIEEEFKHTTELKKMKLQYRIMEEDLRRMAPRNMEYDPRKSSQQRSTAIDDEVRRAQLRATYYGNVPSAPPPPMDSSSDMSPVPANNELYQYKRSITIPRETIRSPSPPRPATPARTRSRTPPPRTTEVTIPIPVILDAPVVE